MSEKTSHNKLERSPGAAFNHLMRMNQHWWGQEEEDENNKEGSENQLPSPGTLDYDKQPRSYFSYWAYTAQEDFDIKNVIEQNENYFIMSVFDQRYDIKLNSNTEKRFKEFPIEKNTVLLNVLSSLFAEGGASEAPVKESHLKLVTFTIDDSKGESYNSTYKMILSPDNDQLLIDLDFLYSDIKDISLKSTTDIFQNPNVTYPDKEIVYKITKNKNGGELKDHIDNTFPNEKESEHNSKQETFMRTHPEVRKGFESYFAKLYQSLKYFKEEKKKDNTINKLKLTGVELDKQGIFSFGSEQNVPLYIMKLYKTIEIDGFIFQVDAKWKVMVFSGSKENFIEEMDFDIIYIGNSEKDILTDLLDENAYKYATNKIALYGIQEITNHREKLALMERAKFFIINEHKRDTHIDFSIELEKPDENGNYPEQLEDKQIETIYYSFTIGREDEKDKTIPVKIERLGLKQNDESNVSVEKIYGYNEEFSDEQFIDWITQRYKQFSVDTKTEKDIREQAEAFIKEQANNAEWFTGNYEVIIVKTSDASEFESAKARLADSKYKENVNGIKEFTPDELLLLELSLQKMSPTTLDMLKGIKFVRINELHSNEEDAHDASGIASRKIREEKKGKQTIFFADSVIYLADNAFEREGIIGDMKQISGKNLWTITHETGHAFGQNLITPKTPVKNDVSKKNYTNYDKITIDDEFHNFLLKIKDTYSYAVPGVTEYAREEQEKKENQPDVEYFAEAFTLYHLDPEFLKTNRPAVYAWFDYVTTKGEAPGWEDGTIENSKLLFREIAQQEVELFKHLAP